MIPFTSTGLPEPAAPVLSQDEFMRSAMDQPLSPMSTFFESVKGGALESYGLGTAIRDFGNAPLADVPENQPTSTLGQALDMTVNAFPPVAAYKAYRSGFQNLAGLDKPSPVLDKDAYERSPYKRTSIPWEPGMTEARAASLATWDDAKQVRDFYREKRPIASFLGGLGGQALDPINYIPVGGEFLAARAGLGIMGRAIAGSAIDAAGNTAAAGLGTATARVAFGDDTSWQSMVSDIAMAGLIGAGFGTIGGALGRRSAARAEAEMTARLGTLKRTQESRVALNEAIDGLINNDEVRLSPNGLAAVDNAAAEVRRLSEAWDQVYDMPTGPVRDPLVAITPADIEGSIVARGAFKDVNEVEFSDRGYGLVKLIWGHGPESKEAPEFQITKDDLLAFPDIVRTLEPKTNAVGARREWRAEINGRTVVFADKAFGDDGRNLVTAYVQRPDGKGAGEPLSPKRNAGAPQPVSPRVSTTAGDTAGGLSADLPGVAGRLPATSNITPETRAANGTPRAEPTPDGLAAASGRVAKTEDVRALAEQHGVDPATGDFVEQADLDQVEAEGRLTEADRATLDEAAKTFEDGDAFAKALSAAVSCII